MYKNFNGDSSFSRYSLPENIEDASEMASQTCIDVEPTSSVEVKAFDILQHGNPIGYLKKECGKVHVGDEELIELLLMTVGCQLCSNTEGLQPDLSGGSGKGKSDACKAVGHLLPQEYFITGSHSALALFHREDIPEGAVIFFDDIEKFSEKEEQLIKTVTSQYQLPCYHHYTDMGKSGTKKSQTVSIPSRLTFWITSVSSSFDPQILNRYLKIQVDESASQDEAVFEQQKEYAKKGSYRFTVTPEVEVGRTMIQQLKAQQPVNVVIPFIDQIKWKGISNRRNYPMILDIIRSSAALNQYQRKRLDDGSIVADLSDFDRAVRLWSKIERAQSTGLTDKEQIVLDAIITSGTNGITQTDIAQTCSIEKWTVSRAIHGIRQIDRTYKGGLMNKLKGGLLYNESNRTYSFNGDLPESETIISLSNRQEAQALIDSYTSCIELQTVATDNGAVSTT